MKALTVLKYGRFPQLIQLPLNNQKLKLNKNQFLIKMKYAPINPSDINFFQGFYGLKKQNTPIVGFQGSGIIQNVQNQQNKFLIGRAVSVLADNNNGTFSTNIRSSKNNIIIWPDDKKFIQSEVLAKISMSWINPFTCFGFSHQIKQKKLQNSTIIISAATSQLSRMLIKYLRKKYPKLQLIGFSRNKKFDQQLINIGLNQIYRVQDDDTIKNLKSKYKKALFLDCIGGQFASKVFNNLPQSSEMISYGRLSKQPLRNIDLGQIYFKNKKIKGFWLNNFLQESFTFSKKNPLTQQIQLKSLKEQLIQLYQQQIFIQSIRKTEKIQNFMDAFRQSIKNQSQGKILFQF